MAKEIRYEFTVEGIWDFPIDMLRYDMCWPEHETSDSVNIAESFRPSRKKSEPTRICLVGLREPTDGRWSSFGWRVVSSRKVM